MIGDEESVKGVDEQSERRGTDGVAIGHGGGIGIPRDIRTECRLIVRND